MAGRTGQPEKMGNSCLKAPAAFLCIWQKTDNAADLSERYQAGTAALQ
jgi:ribosome biogenesis protein Tsr3